MNAKISIIIPAYNIQECLGFCLDSVLAQTYSNLEIIVVNDGSKDGTKAVIDTYAAKDCRIKAIHKENGGVTSARLRGVEEATGTWIGFVDGDDYIEPQMYQRLLENAKEYSADISHCGYQMVFPTGCIDYYYNTGRIVWQEGNRGCYDLLTGSFVEPGLWNKLYHRKLFDGLIDWIDTSIKINEDLLMNYFLFKRAESAVFEDVCPYHYVLRKGSAATSKLNEHKLWDPLKVIHIIMENTEKELNSAVFPRLIRQLIVGATMKLNEQRNLIEPYRVATREELRQRLWSILTSNCCNIKLKIMALWVSVWPASYGWVHNIYAKVTGNDKKYSLE